MRSKGRSGQPYADANGGAARAATATAIVAILSVIGDDVPPSRETSRSVRCRDADGRRPQRADALLAAGGAGAVGRPGGRQQGRDALVARLPLARPAARRSLRRQAGVVLRAASARRRVRGELARRGAGGARAPLRRRPAADRPLGRRRRPPGQGRAARRGRRRLDRSAHDRRARRRRPHVLRRGSRVGRARTLEACARLPGPRIPRRVIEAVVFDLDGVLIQSEEIWDAVREAYVRERGGRYDDEVQRAMMGMSSTEWSRYLHDTAGVLDDPDAINTEVVRRMLSSYESHLPLIDGAVAAVRRLAREFTLGVASSSNRPLIDAVLRVA